MTKIFCNMCGKELPKKEDCYDLDVRCKKLYSVCTWHRIDLCIECAEKFFGKEYIAECEEAKKEHEKRIAERRAEREVKLK